MPPHPTPPLQARTRSSSQSPGAEGAAREAPVAAIGGPGRARMHCLGIPTPQGRPGQLAGKVPAHMPAQGQGKTPQQPEGNLGKRACAASESPHCGEAPAGQLAKPQLTRPHGAGKDPAAAREGPGQAHMCCLGILTPQGRLCWPAGKASAHASAQGQGKPLRLPEGDPGEREYASWPGKPQLAHLRSSRSNRGKHMSTALGSPHRREHPAGQASPQPEHRHGGGGKSSGLDRTTQANGDSVGRPAKP